MTRGPKSPVAASKQGHLVVNKDEIAVAITFIVVITFVLQSLPLLKCDKINRNRNLGILHDLKKFLNFVQTVTSVNCINFTNKNVD